MNIPSKARRSLGALAMTAAVGGALTVGTGALGANAAQPDLRTKQQVAPVVGAAFAMTNATDGNRIVRYERHEDGTLIRRGSVSTGGKGIGVDLDTQGPLRLSEDHQFLYAVNAGSDSVTVFAVAGASLTRVQTIYAGDQPVSLTVHNGLVYVLDGSVASNSIRGFHAGPDGTLSPITGSIQPLSSPIAVPGDIEFSPDGTRILVTEKTTAVTLNPKIALDAFVVNGDGVAGPASRQPSAGIRPFALAFRNDGQAVVAESFDATAGRAAVSSYRVGSNGRLTVRTASARNYQTDSCWIVVSADQRHAYTANFGSGTISSYSLSDSGAVTLEHGAAAFLGADSQPVDLAQTADSGYLYLLLRGSGAVAQFRTDANGGLTPVGVSTGGLPVADGASGLAVY